VSDHDLSEAQDAVLTSSHVLTLSGLSDDVDHLAPPTAASRGGTSGPAGGREGGGWVTGGGGLDRLAPRDSSGKASEGGGPTGRNVLRPSVTDARSAGGSAPPPRGRYDDISLSDDDDEDEKRCVCELMHLSVTGATAAAI
jgi:hypothetical protein